MDGVLYILAILGALFGLFWGGTFGLSLVGLGIILSLLATSVQVGDHHKELLKALGYERPTRKEEFEAAKRELERED